MGEIGKVVTTAMREAVADALPNATPQDRELRIGRILDAIEKLTRLFAPPTAGLVLNTNYMVLVPLAAVAIDDVMFRVGDAGRYVEFLFPEAISKRCATTSHSSD